MFTHPRHRFIYFSRNEIIGVTLPRSISPQPHRPCRIFLLRTSALFHSPPVNHRRHFPRHISSTFDRFRSLITHSCIFNRSGHRNRDESNRTFPGREFPDFRVGKTWPQEPSVHGGAGLRETPQSVSSAKRLNWISRNIVVISGVFYGGIEL